MKLIWSVEKNSRKPGRMGAWESDGIPPVPGQRVYVYDPENHRRVYLVDQVYRVISHAPVSLDVIRPNLKGPENQRFDEALRYAESLYDGVAKFDMENERVNVCMDRAEIILKLDPEAFQDD